MTNARFEDLEKRVLSIKRKKYIKIILFFVVVFGVSFFIFTKVYKVKKAPLHVENKLALKKIVKKEPIAVKVATPKKIKIVKVEPTYDTIKLSPKIDIEEKVIKPKKVEKKVVIQKSTEEKPVVHKKVVLYVKEVKNEEALLERFRAAHDFDSSIALSKLYFDAKKYEKSIYWSKKASKLLSSDSEAWVIYAKSKYAVGKKDEAIKALELYLEYFSSFEVEKLLTYYRNKK